MAISGTISPSSKTPILHQQLHASRTRIHERVGFRLCVRCDVIADAALDTILARRALPSLLASQVFGNVRIRTIAALNSRPAADFSARLASVVRGKDRTMSAN